MPGNRSKGRSSSRGGSSNQSTAPSGKELFIRSTPGPRCIFSVLWVEGPGWHSIRFFRSKMDGQPYYSKGGWAYHSIGKNGRVAPAPLPSNGQVTEVHQKQRWVERPLLLHGWRLNSSVFFPSPGNWFHLIWELLNHYRSIWHQKKEEY